MLPLPEVARWCPGFTEAFISSLVSVSPMARRKRRVRVGELELAILRRIAELNLREFAPRELGIPVRKDRVAQALRRLCYRGILYHVEHGRYRVVADVRGLLERAYVMAYSRLLEQSRES